MLNLLLLSFVMLLLYLILSVLHALLDCVTGGSTCTRRRRLSAAVPSCLSVCLFCAGVCRLLISMCTRVLHMTSCWWRVCRPMQHGSDAVGPRPWLSAVQSNRIRLLRCAAPVSIRRTRATATRPHEQNRKEVGEGGRRATVT